MGGCVKKMVDHANIKSGFISADCELVFVPLHSFLSDDQDVLPEVYLIFQAFTNYNICYGLTAETTHCAQPEAAFFMVPQGAMRRISPEHKAQRCPVSIINPGVEPPVNMAFQKSRARRGNGHPQAAGWIAIQSQSPMCPQLCRLPARLAQPG